MWFFCRFSAATAISAAMAGHTLAASIQVLVQDGSGKALPDAVAYLEPADATRRAAAKPLANVEMAQVARQFEPKVLIIPVGTAVQFPNRDSVRHHVYSFSLIKNFELKLYSGTPASPIVFDKTGVAVLGCNIHDNMVAWVVVVDTPYSGQGGAAGRVNLSNVPAGSYRLRIWHPAMPVGAPALDQALSVDTPDASVTVRIAGLKP